jgi:hypothetical protein
MKYTVDYPGYTPRFESCIDTQSVGSQEEAIALATELSIQLGWALAYGFDGNHYSFCVFFVRGEKHGV